MVISARAVHVVMNGLSDLRMVSSQHMMTSVWDSPQRHRDAHVVQVREIVHSNHHLTVQETIMTFL
jgi:hypothetical protein